MSHRHTPKLARLLMEPDRAANDEPDADETLYWNLGDDESTEGDDIQASAIAEHNSPTIPGSY